MALSDLAVFTDYSRSAKTEVLQENVELFNAASDGAIRLASVPVSGDYSEEAFYAAVSGLVRRRNPYGDGAVAEKVMAQRTDVMVKVAAGTPPIRIDPAWYAWIQRNPREAAVAMGQQLALQQIADMINVAVGAVASAIRNVGAPLINDISGNAGTAALPSPLALANTAFLFGDALSRVNCWVMHSKSWNDLYGNALTNAERLFDYGTVAVRRDPMGRRYIMADLPGLTVPGTPLKFQTLGLAQDGVMIEDQNDYFDNWSTTNGNENIKRTYQAEWSYMVGLKGYSWDKANGGHAPTDAALFTGTNWDMVVTSIKETAGVMLLSK